MSARDASAPAEHGGRSIRLPESPTTAARARSFVLDTLRGWRVEADACDDAELVVSELVTNAFLHGRAPEVGITVADHDDVVRLEVRHREPTPAPVRLHPLTVGADDTHGRGLAIVDVLCSAWGVEEVDGERRVWAELVAGRAGLVPADERDAALAELALALRVPTTAGAVADEVGRWARVRLAASFGGVAVRDDDPDHLQFLSVTTLPPASAQVWVRFAVTTDAPAAAAFREARPFFHESRSAAVAGFPGLGPALEASRLAALAHLPLFDAGRPVGTLSLAWAHGRVLDAGDRSWLAAVAEVVAVALAEVPDRRRDDAPTAG